MQGADKVNGELEVGFDEKFESRWGRIERRGYIVLAVLTAVGLSGLLGRGPLSHRTDHSAASGLSVDFEPITRSQSGTQVTFHFDNPSDADTIDLFLGSHLIEPMGLHQFLPAPVRTRTVTDGLVATIAVPPHGRDEKFRIMLMPLALGPQHLRAQLAGRAPLRWTQFVMP